MLSKVGVMWIVDPLMVNSDNRLNLYEGAVLILGPHNRHVHVSMSRLLVGNLLTFFKSSLLTIRFLMRKLVPVF